MIGVLKPGVRSSLQDLGRFGWQAHGIGSAGAMDTWAARVANVLVGNAENATVVEMTLSGMELKIEQANWFAATGADFDARIDTVALPLCRAVWLERGTVLRFRAARKGCRVYLAVRSGFAASAAFGSTATDTRAGIGGLHGRLLRAADELQFCAPAPTGKQPRVNWSTAFSLPELLSDAPLGLIPGPAYALLSIADRKAVQETAFSVSRDADRMGIRLQQSLPSAAQLPTPISQAVAFGSVQLPGDGRPIVLGADRQTTGGYPLLGAVASVDHCAVAQARPGDSLRFRCIDVAEAHALWRAREQQFQRWRSGVQAWWQEQS